MRNGNPSGRTRLGGFLEHIEKTYGQARRTHRLPRGMDRGIPVEAVRQEMRAPARPSFYRVGTPTGRGHQHEQKWLGLPGQQVREAVQGKWYAHEGER